MVDSNYNALVCLVEDTAYSLRLSQKKQQENLTHLVVQYATREAMKDVRLPKCVRDGTVKVDLYSRMKD
jgi:hypothetical protein